MGELFAHGTPPSEIEAMDYHRLRTYGRIAIAMKQAELDAYKAWKAKNSIKD